MKYRWKTSGNWCTRNTSRRGANSPLKWRELNEAGGLPQVLFMILYVNLIKLNIGDFAAGEVVDNPLHTSPSGGTTFPLGGNEGGPYSGRVFGGEGLYGDTLELEGMDAKAGLTGKVDYDTQGNLGLFRQGETDGSIHELAPCKGFLFALGITDHLPAFADYQTASLHIIYITRGDAEAVLACRQGNGLPETIIKKRCGKAAPLGLELDITMVRGIYVCPCNDTTSGNGIGILPLGTSSLHGQFEKTTAIVGINSTGSRDIGVLVISKVRGGDISVHQCLRIEGKNTQG